MEDVNYIVFKTSGGLNHMLNQINNAIHLSVLLKRKLIVDCWGGAFQNDFNKYFNIPAIDNTTSYDCLYQDELVSPEMFEQYIDVSAKWTKKGYMLADKVVTYKMDDVLLVKDKVIFIATINGIKGNIPWYIRVNREIVDKFSDDKINEEYIGIHYRNTEMKTDLNEIVRELHKYDDDCNTIYLGTDDYTALSRLSEYLKNNMIVIQKTYPPDRNGHSIHWNNPDKEGLIMNALIDMYHLVRAKYFIPSIRSSFSRRIIALRKKDDFFETKV